ncbi:MAG TPA: type II secretion system protein [Candidatus Eisenbacteria bacterium]|nr:type II secretion system protein [Candidatus Eisenbacteria bacterium]
MRKLQVTRNKIQTIWNLKYWNLSFDRLRMVSLPNPFVSWKLGFGSSSKAGFTLVEMLAVVSIFVVVGGIAMTILVTSFRTGHKTDIVTLAQQNGNYALSQMSKTLRNARGIVSPFPCVTPVNTSTVTVVTPDNQQVTYACLSNTIASNGASLLDVNTVNLVSCSFVCSQFSKSDLPVITVSFTLKEQSNSGLAEQKVSSNTVGFQTSVVIRNINR